MATFISFTPSPTDNEFGYYEYSATKSNFPRHEYFLIQSAVVPSTCFNEQIFSELNCSFSVGPNVPIADVLH